jgi:cysteinyl-tRNA synthetase
MAYENEDGVYFDLRAYEEKLGTVSKYGKLAPPAAGSDFFLLDSSEKQDKGATSKKDTRDFVLWKKRKEGEALYWSSPWGEGRPGWHIECSAMIESVSKIFNETHVFAFHAGGIDLKFPHHTNEIAQAEAFHSERLRQQPFQEWIPHWIHTGHLHIDGLKMSKSLKNFISIEELLSQGTESPLSCPADDFRLWCLGLSGSYRAPATYSSQRIDEARKIREKFVQFLIDASEWIRKRDDSSIKAWTTLERDFWTEVHNYFKQSHEALENDMDGASFVKELMKVVEAGNSYMRSSPTKTTEALRDSVTLLRELLALVGFSEKTVFAGVVRKGQKGATEEGIVGGEPVLITEVVSFRRRIRDAALSHVQEQATSALAKEILGVCDEARDRILPSIGLQLVDGKAEEESGYAWRFCIPRVEDTASQMQNYQESKAPIPLSDVALVDFFKTGRYEGMFSQYDEDGIPTKNADGSDISNRLMKKLQKKREKHQRKVDEK